MHDNYDFDLTVSISARANAGQEILDAVMFSCLGWGSQRRAPLPPSTIESKPLINEDMEDATRVSQGMKMFSNLHRILLIAI